MTDLLAPARCPRCAALVRPAQEWCTLCHTDLRPAPPAREPEPLAVEPAEPALPVLPVTSDLSAGKHARTPAVDAPSPPATGEPAAAAGAGSAGASPALDDAVVDAMLAQLARESADSLGTVAGRFDSRGSKVLLAAGVCLAGTVAFMLAAVVLAAVFG